MYKPVAVQVEVTKYQDSEGVVHDTLKEAEIANDTIRAKNDAVFHFGRTFSGKEMLKKYDLSHYGVWEVRGEDSNADMGGYHHEPLIGYFEGTLEQVIRKAYTYDNWMSWGGGGSIKLNSPEKVIKLSEPESTFIDMRELSSPPPSSFERIDAAVTGRPPRDGV